MDYLKRHYATDYAPNTRETFRRQVLHQFVQAGVADYNPFEPDLPPNSPRAHYALSHLALQTVRAFGTSEWPNAAHKFNHDNQGSRERRTRERHFVPVRMPDGKQLELSPGSHNALQRAVVEEFVPRFAPGARLLYLGDAAKKDLVVDEDRLTALGVAFSDRGKLPDILLHDEKRNWLFLIEAVTSHGPVSNKRVVELDALLAKCDAGRVYVTAFLDFTEFRRHMKVVAWETEVWLSEAPDHMIHYNGDRFLGPRSDESPS